MKFGTLTYIQKDCGDVLMLNRKKPDEHLGLWIAPGGKIESNESPVESAVREVKEETGLSVKNLKIRGILTFPDEGYSPFGDEWIVFAFYTNEFFGKLKRFCDEGILHWIPQSKLLDLPMWSGDKLFTPKIFESNVFAAKLLYKGNNLIENHFWDILH